MAKSIDLSDAASWNSRDTAAYLRITSRMVTKLMESGQLRAFRVGRVWRTRPEWVKAWIERQTVGNRTQEH